MKESQFNYGLRLSTAILILIYLRVWCIDPVHTFTKKLWSDVQSTRKNEHAI